MIVHEETRHKSEIALLDNAHLKVQTLCYFMLKSDCQMEIKSHLFQITGLFSACYSSLLILISSENFLKNCPNTWFSHAVSYIYTRCIESAWGIKKIL